MREFYPDSTKRIGTDRPRARAYRMREWKKNEKWRYDQKKGEALLFYLIFLIGEKSKVSIAQSGQSWLFLIRSLP